MNMKMKNSVMIKGLAHDLGADLCGIAPVERFENAPSGFHPYDIYPGTKSVIVIAKREIESTLHTKSPVPYTFSTEIALQKVFSITIDLVYEIEKAGFYAVPVPSEPYEYWDESTMTGRGILSLKHAGHLAGLGALGRNTLLVNQKYGNLIRLGAILTNANLEGDSIQVFNLCSDSCNLCIKNCPVDAINCNHVNQSRCRTNSNTVNKKGYSLYTCNNCRKVCPNRAGVANRFEIVPIVLREIIKVKNCF
jgi:epoxyqueuosine reductase